MPNNKKQKGGGRTVATPASGETLVESPTDQSVAPATTAPGQEPVNPAAAAAVEAILSRRQATFAVLHPDKIVVRYNNRETFEEQEIIELADSIRVFGIIQPLVVLPANSEWAKAEEGVNVLVCGERRLRAARLAEFYDIPCMVRDLTEREFHEVQILENLQRRDVPPLEEARGFQVLINLGKGFSVEELALKLGKSTSYVLQRLQLNELSDLWKDRLRKKQVTFKSALKLSRLPAPIQKKVDEMYKAYHWPANDGDGLLYANKTINDIIENRIYLDLHKAPFPTSDPELNPKMGPCQKCPQRTGFKPALFPELQNEDFCLNADCFNLKKSNHLKNVLATKPDAIKITREHDNKTPGAYKSWNVDWSDVAKPGYQEAVFIDGNDAGKTIYAKVTNPLSATGPMSEDQKEKRREEVRKNRMKQQTQQILAERIAAGLDADDTLRPVIMFYMLESKINYPTQDMKAFLSKHYGWAPIPEDRDTHEKRQGFYREQMELMPTYKLMALFFHIDLVKAANAEYDRSLAAIAVTVPGLDMELVKQDAEQAVVARYYTKKGKKAANSNLLTTLADQLPPPAEAPPAPAPETTEPPIEDQTEPTGRGLGSLLNDGEEEPRGLGELLNLLKGGDEEPLSPAALIND